MLIGQSMIAFSDVGNSENIISSLGYEEICSEIALLPEEIEILPVEAKEKEFDETIITVSDTNESDNTENKNLLGATNGHSRSEAVAWATARANEHWEINDGSGWTQCVEFVWAYYSYLGYDHVRGNANDYLTDKYSPCKQGWTRPNKSTVMPGDIVIWDANAIFRKANIKRVNDMYVKKCGENYKYIKPFVEKSKIKVCQYDLNNNYIQTFGSIEDAKRYLKEIYNITGHVWECTVGKRNSTGGFKWLKESEVM